MPARRGIRRTVAASFSALLLMVPAAAAAPGDLTPAGCFRDLESTPAGCASAQGLDTGWGIVTSADGRNVYAVSNSDDTIVTFERDPLAGGLSFRGCLRHDARIANGCALVPALDGPMGVTISGDDANVYVMSDVSDAVVAFTRDTTGALSFSGCVRDVEAATPACTPAQGLDGPRDVALSPDGGTLYVASAFDDSVAEFGRDLTFRGCVRDSTHTGTGCTAVTGIDGPRGLAVSSDGADVYVAGRDGNTVASFRRAGDGALTWSGCFKDAELAPGVCESAQGLQSPHGVAISPDGKSVYFPAEYDDAVASFERDAATGKLAYRGCMRDATRTATGCTSAEGLDGSRQLEVSADGRSLYVTGAADDAVVHFARDTASGALTFTACFRDPENTAGGCAGAVQGLDGVRAVAVTADGRSVYVNSELDDALARFDREPVPAEPPPPPPPPADTTAPSVSFTAPVAGSTLSGSVACAADAADDTGVVRVEFFVDDAPLSSDATAPYGCAWDTTTAADGAHVLTAVAYDAAGNSSSADRFVTVDNTPPPPPPPPPANLAPAVRLTSPLADGVYRDSLLFAADASDDAGVTKVEFYVDGVLRATDTTAAYRALWQVPKSLQKPGAHTVHAIAYDAQGLTAKSATVTIRYSKSAASATMAKKRCGGKVKRRAAKKSRCAAKKKRRAARAR